MKKLRLKVSAILSGGTFTVWCAAFHSRLGLLRTLELTTLCMHPGILNYLPYTILPDFIKAFAIGVRSTVIYSHEIQTHDPPRNWEIYYPSEPYPHTATCVH